MDEEKTYLGSVPVKIPEINATNGATVNITIVVKGDEDVFERLIKIIESGKLPVIAGLFLM